MAWKNKISFFSVSLEENYCTIGSRLHCLQLAPISLRRLNIFLLWSVLRSTDPWPRSLFSQAQCVVGCESEHCVCVLRAVNSSFAHAQLGVICWRRRSPTCNYQALSSIVARPLSSPVARRNGHCTRLSQSHSTEHNWPQLTSGQSHVLATWSLASHAVADPDTSGITDILEIRSLKTWKGKINLSG